VSPFSLLDLGTSHTASKRDALERRLAGSADLVLRRLGLAALVGWAWHTDGWNAKTMRRLRVYRVEAALVAAAAQFTLPPNEDELA